MERNRQLALGEASTALDDRHVKSWTQTNNVRVLFDALGAESLELALVASYGRDPGLLAVTNRRVLFAASHVRGAPRVVGIERSALTFAAVEPLRGCATIHVWTLDGESVFTLAKPAVRAWRFLGLLFAGMDDAVIPGGVSPLEERVFAADETWLPRRSTQGTTIEMTAEVRAEIRRRGGTLFLWQTGFGRDFEIDRLALERPERTVDFVSIGGGDVDVLVERSLGVPAELRVELGRLPRKHLKVFWDGARWGRRGQAVQ